MLLSNQFLHIISAPRTPGESPTSFHVTGSLFLPTVGDSHANGRPTRIGSTFHPLCSQKHKSRNPPAQACTQGCKATFLKRQQERKWDSYHKHKCGSETFLILAIPIRLHWKDKMTTFDSLPRGVTTREGGECNSQTSRNTQGENWASPHGR